MEQLKRFFSFIRAKTFRTRKNFPGSNATLLPRFLVHSVFVGVIDFVGGSVSLERWGWGVSGMGWCLSEGVGGLSAILGIPSANKDTPRTNLLLIASVWSCTFSSKQMILQNEKITWQKVSNQIFEIQC